jgi:3-oxoacyl-[acyl-carrier protein] reductase
MEKWALVTAGAQGLGGAITEHLLERGWRVAVHYHSSAAKAEALAARGGVTLQADLSRADEREKMIAELSRNTGALHLLVNNLGIYPLEHLLDTSIETFEQTFALTCTAVFHLTQLSLPLLRTAKPSARIINIGDANCDRVEAHDDATPYHIAKLGVHVLTRTYAEQLGKDGITVNMLSPGFLENSVGEPDRPIPLGRKGRFSDITAGLDYLLSDGAVYVSGTNLRVCGGFNL